MRRVRGKGSEKSEGRGVRDEGVGVGRKEEGSEG